MGVASSIGSAVSSKKAAKQVAKEEADIEKKRMEDEDLFNRRYYADVTERSEIKSMLNTLQENQQSQAAREEARAAVTGATAEEKLSAADSRRKTYADAVAKMAENASTLKDGYLTNWQNQRDKYYEQKLGMNDKIAGIYNTQATNQANAAGNAFASGGAMLGQGLGKTFSNNATPTGTPAPAPASMSDVDNQYHT